MKKNNLDTSRNRDTTLFGDTEEVFDKVKYQIGDCHNTILDTDQGIPQQIMDKNIIVRILWHVCNKIK